MFEARFNCLPEEGAQTQNDPLNPRSVRHFPHRDLAKAYASCLALLLFAAGLAACGSSSGPAPSGPAPEPVAALTPATYTFGIQTVGSSSSAQAFTLSNSGNAPLTISSIALSGANAASFTLAAGAEACGTTLAANASCSIYVSFTPTEVANTSATLTITDNTAVTAQTVALSGPATVANGPGQTPDTRAGAMLSLMTQAEKLNMVQGAAPNNNYDYTVPRGAGGWVLGIPRLGIPELYFGDGSVGVNQGIGPATLLPSSIANAASWDLNEATQYGTIIGTELADYGMNVSLCCNINNPGREPRYGRTFETKGEDPILAGKIAAAHISAIQAQHIIGDIKHFSFNDQETGQGTANAVIDDRSGRESDLLAFEIGIADTNVQSVMCAYSLTNGQYNCENSYLLNQVLKGDWAFPGFVMSDWLATHTTVNAALNGLDQEQPDHEYFSQLGAAITAGQVPQSRLDNMAQRILRAMYAEGIFDYPQTIQAIPAAADAAVAQQLEEHGAVLLKNAGNRLPLNASTIQSIAVIGLHADTAVLTGGGSSQVLPSSGVLPGSYYPAVPGWFAVVWALSSPLNAIQAKAPVANVQFADGTDAAAAASLAAASQVAIVFVSQWESEGMDQTTLGLTDLTSATPVDQDALVEAVAAANPNTIVVVESGGAILMPWLDHVRAVLEAWFPGQSGAPAIADLLFGTTNPSGKLPITFPASDSQLPRPVIPQPPDDVTPFDVNFEIEGYNVGYKWFDSQGLTPLFPFGFGLSYTTFSMTNAALANNLASATKPNFQVTFTLTNTGAVAGAEVAQVYLGMPASLNEPPKRLVGWQKVLLQPGASQPVTIEVDQNDSSQPMSYWNTTTDSWQVASGKYTVYLGNSSAMASLTTVGTITVP
jgi:beta-glucosidase